MSANAIPREINLANTKPAATPAYVRRFSNLSSNGNTFVDGQNIRINIDTSTPGAFIDPYSAYLEFDFTVSRSSSNSTFSSHCSRYVATHGAALDTQSTILNSTQSANQTTSGTSTVWYQYFTKTQNTSGTTVWGPKGSGASDVYFNDTIEYNYPQVGENDVLSDNSNYYRLPRCGAHAFIDEFRIYIQGVPIEEITSYNALAELLHDLNGVRDATDATSSARYRANGYPDLRTPHYPGILPIKQIKTNSWNVTAQPTSNITTASQNAAAASVNGYGTGSGKGFGIHCVDAVGPPAEIFSTTSGGYNWQPDNGRLLAYAPGYGNFGFQAVNAGTSSSTFTNTVYDGDYSNKTGNSTEPSLLQQNNSYGTPAVYIDCLDTQELRAGVTYRVQVPLLSGVLGTMADKMFPSLLVASGTMYIDIKLASATQAVVAAVSNLMGCSVDDQNMFPKNASTGTNYQFPTNIIGTTTGSSQRGPTTFAVPNTNNGAFPGFQDNPMGLSIKNVSFVAKQVILQDSVTSAIVSRAAAGDISVHTTSYRGYSTDASNSSTAYSTSVSGSSISPITTTLLVPAKIASANALFVIFRDSAVLTAQRYNSLGRIAIGLNPTGNGASVQLRIGNELLPQTPITSSTEALIELMKAHHQYPDMKSTCLLGTIRRPPTTYYKYTTGSQTISTNYPGLSAYTTTNSGYPTGYQAANTAVTPYDQNYYTDYQQWNDFNANMIQFPVTGSIAAQYGGNACTDCSGTVTTSGTAPTSTTSNVARQTRAHTYMGGNLYEPAWYSTFALGFDLDTFAYDSGEIRSGRYMGNNVVTLSLNNARMYNVDYSTTTRNVRVDYFVQHDVRLSFQAGGVCQSFY